MRVTSRSRYGETADSVGGRGLWDILTPYCTSLEFLRSRSLLFFIIPVSVNLNLHFPKSFSLARPLDVSFLASLLPRTVGLVQHLTLIF